MKKLKYDYLNFDRFTAQAKRDKQSDLERYYFALGYNKVDEREDKQYEDLVYLTFERPHNVKNKDKLQYLQVEIENELNDIAHFDMVKSAKSTIVGIILGLFSLGLVLGGIFSLIKFPSVYLSLGISLIVLGVGVGILNFFLCKSIYEKDKVKYQEKTLAAQNNLERIYEYILKLREGENGKKN